MTRFAPLLAAFLFACSASELEPLDPLPDGGGSRHGDATASTIDTGASAATDAGTQQFSDAGSPPTADAGSQMGWDTSAAGDAGSNPPVAALVPGRSVTTARGRVSIGDRFDSVVGALGQGTRTAQMNARSYEHALGGGVTLTVWYANTNLDNDDAAPANVDDSDLVLWIAVEGAFAGTTASGVGIGSSQADVRSAYGPPSRTSPIDTPPGTVDAYYETGLLAAYGNDNRVRTMTISRAYPNDPDGTLELADARIRFGRDTVLADLFSGTDKDDVKRILGNPPDGEGDVTIEGATIRVLSYGFIGLEIFTGRRSGRTLFVSVHAPFYGTAGSGANAVGIGSTRADFESYLATEGFDPARMSTAMNVFCYRNRGSRRIVGASYSAEMPSTVTTISVGLPDSSCP